MLTLIVYTTIFFALVFTLIGIGLIIIEWIDTRPQPDYDLIIESRINRDQELQRTFYYLTTKLGREPTVRELWKESPPFSNTDQTRYL